MSLVSVTTARAETQAGDGLPAALRLPMTARRWVVLVITTGLIIALTALMAATLSRGGFGATDLLLTALFAMTLPWTVIGFLNALVGMIIMRTAREPVRAVCPVTKPPTGTALRGSVAIALCVRNEDVAAVARNLEHMLADLERAGVANHFHAYVLSDSDEDSIVEAEEQTFHPMTRRRPGRIPVDYRRRADQTGFKAGNIREFLSRWGHGHEYMLVLDADSVMTAGAVIRLVRVMEANPRLGILQSMMNGLPAASAFARVFQYGMRLGMRSYTIGSAWWQGDCGPYWGHNALIRVAPFIEHCRLPHIAGGGVLSGCVLSHDQVEAVLMRRAGFEVRVLPDATGSFEENPPSLVEFVRRDLRWCLGNMQYLHLLRTPGLLPVSRMQLVLAILMYAGSPAWMAFIAVASLPAGLVDDVTILFDPELGAILFACVLGMAFAPKIATAVDVLLDPQSRRVFGGGMRVVLSVIGELIFSALLAPIMAIAHTRLIAGLPFGRRKTWPAQRRGAHRVRLGEGWRRFWPQTLAGAAVFVWIGLFSPVPLWSVLPLALGPLLVVPFTAFTASTSGSRLFLASGLWRTPEEISPPPDLASLILTEGSSVPARDATDPALESPLPALVATAAE